MKHPNINIQTLLALLITAWLASAGAFAQSLSSTPPSLGAGGFESVEFLPVEEAYPLAVERVDESSLLLIWQMPPGYYLYQRYPLPAALDPPCLRI